MRRGLRPLPSPPAFFLAQTPDDGRPALLSEEAEHALRVLRLQVGDLCLGLDGRGHRWPLRIAALDDGAVEVEGEGLPEIEPEPGAEGAPLPWIEVAVAWPKKTRAEPMIGGLVQLGAAAITPLDASYRGPEPVPESPPSRWEKLARVACKQSHRAWLPAFSGATSVADLVEARLESAAALAFLDPRGGMSLDTWLRSLMTAPIGVGTRERPIVLVVGPEGGFAPEERGILLEAGVSPMRMGPHVLRVETAALAAMSVAGTLFADHEGGWA